MIMYKLQQPIFPSTESNCVIRNTDGACIPFDPANTDYQEFLRYKEAGGKVYEADEEVPVNG
jgi:hypothetical protein